MSADGCAGTPKPPYYAVIFSSQRPDVDDDYGKVADHMVELASSQPGYLGIETCRGADNFGITVSYWDSEAAIAAWRANADHAIARARGRSEFYQRFELRVARVERAYGGGTATREAPP